MRRIRKLLSALIVITFIFNFVSLCKYSIYADVVDSRGKNDIDKIIENFENPLYEGLNVKEYSPKDNINSKSVSVFNSLEEAAIFVRDEMVNRKGNISFILPKELYHSGILEELVELATEDYDNGKSSEGDYLHKHCGGCSAKIKSYSNGQYQYDINMRYLSTYEQEEQVDKAVDEVLDNLNIQGKDDYTKIKLIHDYIVENIRYDYTYSKYSTYNAIIGKKVVCQGFSSLTYKMFKEAGLKVRIITGPNHAWNIVKLGDKWYNIDNTWDSCYSESGPLSYEWFLKDKYNFPDHTRDSEYNTSEFNEKYPMATVPYSFSVNNSTQNGWVKVNDKWYYYSNGVKKIGWLNLGGKWYYLKANGQMSTGWQAVGGKWYYLNLSGEMATGWKLIDGNWYYLDGSGAMKTGWLNLNGTWYYLDGSGAMKTGWLNLKGIWYYMYGSGKMATNTTIDGWKIGSNGVASSIK